MVVLPPGHDLEKREILSFSDVIRFPVVALQAGGSLYQVLKDRADGAGSSLNLAVTVNSFDAQCRMVEAGLGIDSYLAAQPQRSLVRITLCDDRSTKNGLEAARYTSTRSERPHYFVLSKPSLNF